MARYLKSEQMAALPEYSLRIRELRARTGLSQIEFGKYMYGIPRRTLQAWETGTSDMPLYTLGLIEDKVNRDFPEEE